MGSRGKWRGNAGNYPIRMHLPHAARAQFISVLGTATRKQLRASDGADILDRLNGEVDAFNFDDGEGQTGSKHRRKRRSWSPLRQFQRLMS